MGFVDTIKDIYSKISGETIEQKFISNMASNGWNYVGNQFNGCGNVRIDGNTMFRIPKINKMAGAYLDKITDMIASDGICIVDPNTKELVEGGDLIIERATNFFSTGTSDNMNLDNFVRDFFLQYFCSGEVSVVPSEINLYSRASKKAVAKVLDTRGIQKHCDEYGNIKKYRYVFDPAKKSNFEEFIPKEICNLVLLKDHDNPMYGYSRFTRIVIEALTNLEANQKQLYTFTNNSAPNMLIMLHEELKNDPNAKKKIEAFGQMWNAKFRGSTNTGKPLFSDTVSDIKLLDLSNVDMDYLNIRKENEKDFALIFMLDTRLVGLSKDTGSFSEVESMTIRQGNSQIEAYGRLLSNAMTIIYKKFIDPKFEYEFKCLNSQFRDIVAEKEISLKEVDMGTKSANEHRLEFEMPESDEEHMEEYIRTGLAKTAVPKPTET